MKIRNKDLLNKVKLWCVLHHCDIHKAVIMNCAEGVCHCWPGEGKKRNGCGLPWPARLAVNKSLTKIGHEAYEESTLDHCVEWIKHV